MEDLVNGDGRRGRLRGRGAHACACWLHRTGGVATRNAIMEAHPGSHDISFGVGPAGTGKTYLAVALRGGGARDRARAPGGAGTPGGGGR